MQLIGDGCDLRVDKTPRAEAEAVLSRAAGVTSAVRPWGSRGLIGAGAGDLRAFVVPHYEEPRGSPGPQRDGARILG
jgi:hypothetical protein